MHHFSEVSGMGWLPDYPDFRDYTEKHEEIYKVLAPTKLLKRTLKIPAAVDLT